MPHIQTTADHITIYAHKYRTFVWRFIPRWQDGTAWDLTGATAEMQVRERPESGVILAHFKMDDLSLVVDAETPQIVVSAPEAVTGTWNWKEARFDMKVKLKDGPTETTHYGKFLLIGSNTP